MRDIFVLGTLGLLAVLALGPFKGEAVLDTTDGHTLRTSIEAMKDGLSEEQARQLDDDVETIAEYFERTQQTVPEASLARWHGETAERIHAGAERIRKAEAAGQSLRWPENPPPQP